MTMDDMMIEMEDLVKRFPHTNEAQKSAWKTAVSGVTFSVRRGEVFGLLGPNGAGKTTIIRMLTMQTQPTSGIIRIDGCDIREHALTIKKKIGVVPQHVNFDQELSVWENMELHARLHHMGRAERTARIQQLLAEMRTRGMDAVVMEVSSHALDQGRVAGIEFDTAVFTNLTQDHLDYHKTMENYARAKARLFDLVSEQGVKEGKTAILNADDAAAKTMRAHTHCPLITYGVDMPADLTARKIHLGQDGMELTIAYAGAELPAFFRTCS
mgnify:CR=1 FL=1